VSTVTRKIVDTWEARIYVGSREGYEGRPFGAREVLDAIALYQRNTPEERRGCVSVTPTSYKFDKYEEQGWVVGIMAYPRFPQSGRDLLAFSEALAYHLFEALKQNRVSVATPHLTVMFERGDAQQHPIVQTKAERKSWCTDCGEHECIKVDVVCAKCKADPGWAYRPAAATEVKV
jgi:hypothetical protein